jgi:hypothetical protein
MREEFCPLLYATLQAFWLSDYLSQGSLSHIIGIFDGQAWPESDCKEKNKRRKKKWVKHWVIVGIFNDAFTTV